MTRLTLIALLLFGGRTAAAQDSEVAGRVAQAELTASIGWLNARHPQNTGFGEPDNWLNDIAYGSAAGGRYVTDHIKTELEVFTTTRGRQYRYERVLVNGIPTTSTARVRLGETGVSGALQYQFFHNAWAQPYVSAGIEVAHETTSDEYDPIFLSDPVTHVLREAVPPRTDTAAEWNARPFAGFGGKAYVTRRAFLFGDTRLALQRGINRVLLRGGVGVEF